MIKNVLPPRKSVLPASKATVFVILGVSTLLTGALVQGQFVAQTAHPAYYFYDQPAPPGYAPFGSTPFGQSLLMHLALPPGPDASLPIGKLESSSVVFFSDPAPANLRLPFGASVSLHVWINDTQTPMSNGTLGNLKFRIDIFNPANNTISHIEGAGETQVIALQQGVDVYQAIWGHIAQNKEILKGETLVATIWCPDCQSPPMLLFNSPSHPSNIDFPIEVPENSIYLASMAVVIPGIAGLFVERQRGRKDGELDEKGRGFRMVQTYLIIAAAVVFLTLPLMFTFNDLLASLASATGFDRVVSVLAPIEASAVADLLRGFGLQAGSSAWTVWLGVGFLPVTAVVDWNCVGWQGLALFGLTSTVGLQDIRTRRSKAMVALLGIGGIFAINVLRIFLVVLLGYYVSYPAALMFHNYGGAVMTLAFLLGFWTLALRGSKGEEQTEQL